LPLVAVEKMLAGEVGVNAASVEASPMVNLKVVFMVVSVLAWIRG
jgi:hypothetical protein